jgi:DNA-binding transcriptional MerR regulator
VEAEHRVRIGELSRRVGVSPELLRAWERRYGLLRPERTSGGFRLYSAADERRIQAMQQQLALGLSAAEAASAALAATEDEPAAAESAGGLTDGARALEEALDGLDDGAAQAALDGLFGAYMLETVLGEVILPYLRRLGERWERNDVTIGQEHFASNLLRARLLGLARGWGRSPGPRALLACAPGELHDLPLIIFGLALRARGWRITFLGPDTPVSTVAETAQRLAPVLVVVSAAQAGRLEAAGAELRALARKQPLAIAGTGADHALARKLRCRALPADPLAAAAASAAA